MQHYVATRPMFIDVEVMNADTRSVLGDHGSQPSPSNVSRGLAALYKEITGLEDYHKHYDTLTVICSSLDLIIVLILVCRYCA